MYRHRRSKLTSFFRPSTGLRHRARTDRNIYCDAHTGISAIDLPPPYPAPSIEDALRTMGRSATVMALPAVPPSGNDTSVPESEAAEEYAELLESDSATQPSGNTNPSLEEMHSNRNQSRLHDVPLPLPVKHNPESDESESDEYDEDESDNDCDEMPEHRMNVIPTSHVRNLEEPYEWVKNTPEVLKPLNNQDNDGQKVQYVNVCEEVMEKETDDCKNMVKDSKDNAATHYYVNCGATSKIIHEEDNPIQYVNIDETKKNPARDPSQKRDRVKYENVFTFDLQ